MSLKLPKIIVNVKQTVIRRESDLIPDELIFSEIIYSKSPDNEDQFIKSTSNLIIDPFKYRIFYILGTQDINFITHLNWNIDDYITLVITNRLIIKNDVISPPSGFSSILLQDDIDIKLEQNSSLTLKYNGSNWVYLEYVENYMDSDYVDGDYSE